MQLDGWGESGGAGHHGVRTGRPRRGRRQRWRRRRGRRQVSFRGALDRRTCRWFAGRRAPRGARAAEDGGSRLVRGRPRRGVAHHLCGGWDQRLARDAGPGGSDGDSRGRHDPGGPLRLQPPSSPPGESPTRSQSPHSGPAASTRQGLRDQSAHKHKRSRKEDSSRGKPPDQPTVKRASGVIVPAASVRR